MTGVRSRQHGESFELVDYTATKTHTHTHVHINATLHSLWFCNSSRYTSGALRPAQQVQRWAFWGTANQYDISFGEKYPLTEKPATE